MAPRLQHNLIPFQSLGSRCQGLGYRMYTPYLTPEAVIANYLPHSAFARRHAATQQQANRLPPLLCWTRRRVRVQLFEEVAQRPRSSTEIYSISADYYAWLMLIMVETYLDKYWKAVLGVDAFLAGIPPLCAQHVDCQLPGSCRTRMVPILRRFLADFGLLKVAKYYLLN